MNLLSLLWNQTKNHFARTLFLFENISLSPIQTQSLLDGSINDKINLDYEDTIIVRNVINALDFLDNCNLETLKLNSDLYIHLNELLANEQALDVGYFRNSNVSIGCIDGAIPPVPKENIEKSLNAIANINKDNFKEVIAENFCKLIRMQPFFDANKRTTLFFCNTVLLKKQLGIFFIENEKYDIFENELTKYYTEQLDCKLQEFLVKDCIKSISELDIDQLKNQIKHNNIKQRR